MIRLLIAMLAALPLVTRAQGAPEAGPSSAPPEASPAPPPRDAPAGRVYAGAGFGPTFASFPGGDNSGSAYRLRIGATRSARLMIGLEAGLQFASNVDITWYDAGVTFFPWGKYLYLRGAAGLTTLSARRDEVSEQGLNVLLGAGVALGAPRGVTVSLNVEGQNHFTSLGAGLGPASDATALSVWLGVDFY